MGITQQIGASSLIQPGVIDNAAARPASPFEGQTIFQKDTDQLLVWNGTAWVIPNQTTTNPNGLELIKTDTITSGTSKEITGVFSSEFKNYKIIVSNGQSSGATGLRMLLGTTATGVYYWSGISLGYGGSQTNETAAAGSNFNTGGVLSSGGNKGGGVIELQMPQQATTTAFQAQFADPRTNGTGGRNYTGFVNNTTQYTSFSFITEGGVTFSSCDIAVYGYRNS